MLAMKSIDGSVSSFGAYWADCALCVWRNSWLWFLPNVTFGSDPERQRRRQLHGHLRALRSQNALTASKTQ